MRAVVVVVAVVAATVVGGCATVEGYVNEDKFAEACVLAHEDGLFKDRFADLDVLRLAVAARVDARVSAVAVDDARDVDDSVVFATLRVAVPANTSIVVQETSSSFLQGEAALARVLGALPPIDDAPPLVLPPGPLTMPPPPDPSPPAPASSSRSGGGGFLGAMFELITLPFQIAGEVASSLMSIPFDLFGVSSPFRGGSSSSSSSSSSTLPPADPRLPGEAILPPEAWEREKARLTQEHEAAVAAVDAARAAQRARALGVVARLAARCRATAAQPCERLVLVPDDGATTVTLRAGLGADCGVDDDLTILAKGALPTPQPPTKTTSTKTKTPTTTTLPEQPALPQAQQLWESRKSGRPDADAFDDVVCRVDVKPRWKRLLPRSKTGALSVRLATGALAGQGTTVEVPPSLRFFVGKKGAVAKGDHLKIAVAVVEEEGAAFFGGAVGVVDGFPLRLSGENLSVECR